MECRGHSHGERALGGDITAASKDGVAAGASSGGAAPAAWRGELARDATATPGNAQGMSEEGRG